MSNLLIDCRPLMVLPPLVSHFNGDYTKALILQQIHFLASQPRSGVDHEGHHWVWFTYEEWCEDTFTWMSSSGIGKQVRDLEKLGYIISTTRIRDQWDNTKHYRLNYELFDSAAGGTIMDTAGGTIMDTAGGTVFNRTETSSKTSTETSRDDAPVDGESQNAYWDAILTYWRVKVTGKKPATVVEEWLWGLYLRFGGELVLEAVQEAARNNKHGGAPTYNFVGAICERMHKNNVASEQRRLAINGETASGNAPEYVDENLERLRQGMLGESNGNR